jgi:hypothetical protein
MRRLVLQDIANWNERQSSVYNLFSSVCEYMFMELLSERTGLQQEMREIQDMESDSRRTKHPG